MSYTNSPPAPVTVFFSYSHKDERLRDKLATHLSNLQRQDVIKSWHDRKITAGTNWAKEIDDNLDAADIILLLVSADFLNSDYCYEVEMERAIARHKAGEARVIPIILRPVDWKGALFGEFQALPKNARPVTKWSNQDEAFANVAEGVRQAALEMAEELRNKPARSPAATSTLSASSSAKPNLLTALNSSFFTVPLETAMPISEAVQPRPYENPEGAIRVGSEFYIRSSYEERCYEEIQKGGALIRIKSPRNMGKSSLMLRVLAHAEQLGYRTVSLNLDEANKKLFDDLDKYIQWFCASVGKQLGVRVKTEEYWEDIFGANDNCTDYFKKYLLEESDRPLVIAIDNFDQVFKYPDIETDFCGLLRGWHERSRIDPLWENLRFIIVYSLEPYLLKDINQSPFNVGLPVELGEFSAAQVKELVTLHRLNWTNATIEQFMALVGGHPYLVRSALYHIAIGDQTLDDFFRTAPTEAGIYKNHLVSHLRAVEANPALKAAMKMVVSSADPISLNSDDSFKLDSMGLVMRIDNQVRPRCQLYRQYFCDRLGA
ncbi:hypothetical protein O77CONTIG1_04807 [Leptolyngbya sp. O-77]|nr:hypothetical protein O77CONTIG1_04807 [Leptolyngbya sp. O-77]